MLSTQRIVSDVPGHVITQFLKGEKAWLLTQLSDVKKVAIPFFHLGRFHIQKKCNVNSSKIQSSKLLNSAAVRVGTLPSPGKGKPN